MDSLDSFDDIGNADSAAATALAENPQLEQEVSGWMEQLFGKEVVHRVAPGANMVPEVRRGGTRHLVVNEGFGLNQILWLLIKLSMAPQGSINCIEEPEISLHPEAQVSMAAFLAKTAASGKQIIATTHSSLLLLALGKAIRNPDIGLSPSDVAIYEIVAGPGGSKAKRLPLDEKGNIKGWSKTQFGKVERELLHEWSASLPEV